MEGLEHSLWVVEAFNRVFGPPLAAVLGLVGVEVPDPLHVVPDYLVMVLIVALALIVLLGLASRRLALVPRGRQNIVEMIVQLFEGLAVDTIGPQGRKYLPVIGTVGLFVFGCNMIGLVPGFMSPTSKLNVTLGCALVVFFYYHAQGVKAQGLKYFKHFMGPIPALAPLMIPIEVISHFSRPVSLSMRLFGNIFAEELLIVIMASIIPFLLPLPFMAVAIFTSVIQSFVFVLLSCIYIAGAVAHEEEH
ncbi:MAG: F0F1 ATP synthase subunit A [Acidobacteria bacterium]|nr:F0F1 ATP synthase subunit A [Acidobacteriota bacterium]MBE3124583.1 F0F1 ATP synthase subunit A [Acidobacteriota bacterium]